ncbi:MAG TPA: hypothetical protein ENK53_00325 [Thiotrichales bacterium]|nr:hypothetical protein [Thiotrichales bacterium]
MTGLRQRFSSLPALLVLGCLLAVFTGLAHAEALVRFKAGALKSPVRVGEPVVFGGTFHIEGVPVDQIAAWPARVRWVIRRRGDDRPLARGEVRIDRQDLPFVAQVRAARPGRYVFVLEPAVGGDGYRYRLPEPLVVEARSVSGQALPVVRFRPATVPESIVSGETVNFGGVLEIDDPVLLDRLAEERIHVGWQVERAADGQVVDSGEVRLAGARTLLLVSVRPPGPGRYRLRLIAPGGAPYRLESPQTMPEVEVKGQGGA